MPWSGEGVGDGETRQFTRTVTENTRCDRVQGVTRAVPVRGLPRREAQRDRASAQRGAIAGGGEIRGVYGKPRQGGWRGKRKAKGIEETSVETERTSLDQQ